jgi:hypothetical protein
MADPPLLAVAEITLDDSDDDFVVATMAAPLPAVAEIALGPVDV